MKIVRTENRKFAFKKLTWTDYCQIVKVVNQMVDKYADSAQVTDRILGLVLIRMERKLSKADYYPLKDSYYRKEKVSITLEAEEALTLWYLYPCDMTDPVRSIMNLELPKYF